MSLEQGLPGGGQMNPILGHNDPLERSAAKHADSKLNHLYTSSQKIDSCHSLA